MYRWTTKQLIHATRGDFTPAGRPTGGGHSWLCNLRCLRRNGYNAMLTTEVRNRKGKIQALQGYIPGHRDSRRRMPSTHPMATGDFHSWFPKDWTKAEIKKAGELVANSRKNNTQSTKNRAEVSGVVERKWVRVRVIVYREVATGLIMSCFPSRNQPTNLGGRVVGKL
jgi:hypothetical protein